MHNENEIRFLLVHVLEHRFGPRCRQALHTDSITQRGGSLRWPSLRGTTVSDGEESSIYHVLACVNMAEVASDCRWSTKVA